MNDDRIDAITAVSWALRNGVKTNVELARCTGLSRKVVATSLTWLKHADGDPDRARALRNANQRENNRERLRDPEARERRRAYAREYRAKRCKDPGYRERVSTYARRYRADRLKRNSDSGPGGR